MQRKYKIIISLAVLLILGIILFFIIRCVQSGNKNKYISSHNSLRESYIDNLDEVEGSITGVIQLGSHECSEATDKHVGSNYIWIEAIPSVQEKCRKNASKFGQKSIQALLWNKTGEKKDFHIYNGAQSSSVFQLGKLNGWDKDLDKGGVVELETITYQDLAVKYPELRNPIYNHLVIDVQGAEYEVIQGMGGLIRQFETIDCELTAGDENGNMHYIGQRHQKEVDKLLVGLGFKCVKNCTPSHGVALYRRISNTSL